MEKYSKTYGIICRPQIPLVILSYFSATTMGYFVDFSIVWQFVFVGAVSSTGFLFFSGSYVVKAPPSALAYIAGPVGIM